LFKITEFLMPVYFKKIEGFVLETKKSYNIRRDDYGFISTISGGGFL